MVSDAEATVLAGIGRPEPQPSAAITPRMVALAAAVEALSNGHARTLAAELRALLEAASDAAPVVSIASRRNER